MTRRGARDHTVRHLVLDQVIPLLLNLRGQEVLHASAVLTRYGVCAFAARTGTGKSTLACSLLAANCPVISDDCLALHEGEAGIYVTSSYPGLRLWRDALSSLRTGGDLILPVAEYTSKQRLVPDKFATGCYPLAAIYCLERSAPCDERVEPKIQRLSPREALLESLSHTFSLDPAERERVASQFNFLKRLATSVPIKHLLLPNSLSSLPAVREAILSDLERGLAG